MRKIIVILSTVMLGLSINAKLHDVPYAKVGIWISSIVLAVLALFWIPKLVMRLLRTKEVEIEGDVVELEHRDIMPSVDSPGTSYSWMKVKTREGVLQSVRINYALYYILNEKFKQSKKPFYIIMRGVNWITFNQITGQVLLYPL